MIALNRHDRFKTEIKNQAINLGQLLYATRQRHDIFFEVNAFILETLYRKHSIKVKVLGIEGGF
jgi:hypothetical protein